MVFLRNRTGTGSSNVSNTNGIAHNDNNTKIKNNNSNKKKERSWWWCFSAVTSSLLPQTKQDIKNEDVKDQEREEALKKKQRIQKLCITLIVALLGFEIVMKILNSLTVDQMMAVKGFGNDYIFGYGDDVNGPAFQEEGYLDDYPYLKVIEDNYETIKEELSELVKMKIPRLGDYSDYVAVGEGDWRTFFFRLGDPIPENRKWAPKTFDIINTATQTNDISLAMVSITAPHNGIPPHWGYFKGFTRYHLGVLIPNNNMDKKTCLRINKHHHERDPIASKRIKEQHEYSVMENATETQSYYWKNGKGVVFDDTYLHEVVNDADGIRVVLFLDLLRKYPTYMFYKSLLNRIIIKIAFKLSYVQNLRTQYVYKGPDHYK